MKVTMCCIAFLQLDNNGQKRYQVWIQSIFSFGPQNYVPLNTLYFTRSMIVTILAKPFFSKQSCTIYLTLTRNTTAQDVFSVNLVFIPCHFQCHLQKIQQSGYSVYPTPELGQQIVKFSPFLSIDTDFTPPEKINLRIQTLLGNESWVYFLTLF